MQAGARGASESGSGEASDARDGAPAFASAPSSSEPPFGAAPGDALPPKARSRINPYVRIGGLALLVVAGWTILFATGLIDAFDEAALRAQVNDAGAYGIALFLVVFIVAQLLHLPGSFFIAVAGAAWGWALGGAIAWVASVIAITVNFAFVKTVGGEALLAIDRPVVAKLLAHLHHRPKATIFVARALFMTSPWLAATLALAGVRQRDHFMPSAIGIAPQVLLWTVGVDWLL